MNKKSVKNKEEVHVYSLASGSEGNATLIQMGEQKVLLDVGISARKIENSLLSLGVSPESIDAVFLTHEHRDHVAGLATMAKKYKMPFFATLGTRKHLPKNCLGINENQWSDLSLKMEIGAMQIEPFKVSHDAADTVGYNFFWRDIKVSAVTDLGFVTSTVKSALTDSDIMLLESNHDVEMLRCGRYPQMLKQRIASTKGHLSNLDAAWTLARLARKERQKIILAHLSKENNCEKVALETVSDILKSQDFKVGKDCEIEIKVAKKETIVGF